MATVNKNFRIKDGLIVEGTTGTINGEDILTTGSTTDDLGEGSSNLYYTDARVDAEIVDRLTNATLNNISITADGTDLTITAENGIADSTTDDLAEGEDNLYFTNQRALDATASAYDAAGAASSAQTAAESYADSLASNYDAAGSASAAQTAAESYADSLASNYDAAGAASQAETNANTYTDTALEDYTPTSGLDAAVDGYGYLKSADLSGYATESYVDTAITELVDGAPGLLDTLNELAAAIGDDENYAVTVANLVAAKADAANPVFTIGDGPGSTLYTATGMDFLGNYGPGQPNYYYIRPDETGMSGITSLNLQQDFFTVIISGTGTAYDGTWKGYKAESWALRFYGPVDAGSLSTFSGSDFTFEIKEGIPAKTVSSAELARLDGLTAPIVTTAELDAVITTVNGKQDALTAGSNIDITDDVISVTGLASTDISDFNTAALSATASAYDASGAASTAEQNAKDYADETFVTLDSLPGQLDDYIPTTDKGADNGVATLDGDGYVPLSQLGNVPTAYVTSVGANLSVTDGELDLASNVLLNETNISALSLTTGYGTTGDFHAVSKTASQKSNITAGTPYSFTFQGQAIKLLISATNGSDIHVSEALIAIDPMGSSAYITEYGTITSNVDLFSIASVTPGNPNEISISSISGSITVKVVATSIIGS